MREVRRHPRLVALAAVLAALLAVLVVAALRSRPAAGCELAAPRPDLPAQLRSLGGFDQPLDGTDPRILQETAEHAASALDPTLGAVVAGDPVTVRSRSRGGYDAVVVPLRGAAFSAGPAPRTEGLVAFLRGCGSQVYYSRLDDLVRSLAGAQLPSGFPTVGRDSAAARLGAQGVELSYDADPFAPVWIDPRTGRSVPAT